MLLGHTCLVVNQNPNLCPSKSQRCLVLQPPHQPTELHVWMRTGEAFTETVSSVCRTSDHSDYSDYSDLSDLACLACLTAWILGSKETTLGNLESEVKTSAHLLVNPPLDLAGASFPACLSSMLNQTLEGLLGLTDLLLLLARHRRW